MFGLDGRDPSDARDNDDSSAQTHVVVTYGHRTLLNSAAREPMVDNTGPVATDMPVVTAEGAMVPVTMVDSTFEFDVPRGAAYEVRFGDVEYQTSAARASFDVVHYGRTPDPVTSTVVDLTLSLAPAATTPVQLVSTGVFAQLEIKWPQGSTGSFEWTKASFAGPAGKVKTSANDGLYAIELVTVGAITYAWRAATLTLDMADEPQMLSALLPAVTRDKCSTVRPSGMEELTRLQSAYPSYVNATRSGWEIDAVPFPSLGLDVARPLAMSYSAAGSNLTTSVLFGLPYVGHAFVATQVTSAARRVLGYTLTASTSYSKEIAPDSSCPEVRLGESASAIAVDHELAGIELATEPLTIGIPSGNAYAELTWTVEGAEVPGLYIVELLELPVPHQAGPVSLRTIYTAEPRARIAKDLFVAGKSYIARISTRSNRARAALGDFTERGLPVAESSVLTTVFQVVQ